MFISLFPLHSTLIIVICILIDGFDFEYRIRYTHVGDFLFVKNLKHNEFVIKQTKLEVSPNLVCFSFVIKPFLALSNNNMLM